jgi:hypothetical protein
VAETLFFRAYLNAGAAGCKILSNRKEIYLCSRLLKESTTKNQKLWRTKTTKKGPRVFTAKEFVPVKEEPISSM